MGAVMDWWRAIDKRLTDAESRLFLQSRVLCQIFLDVPPTGHKDNPARTVRRCA